jgi:hypothetical protein
MVGFALLAGVLCVATAQSTADEPGKQSDLHSRLIGTWKMTSAKYGGEAHEFPAGTTMVKHVTPTHFMWATYDEDGAVSRAAGGTYTLKESKYEEHPEYGISVDFDIIKGKPQSFTCEIDGDKWHHHGALSNGLTIDEVWVRMTE